MGSGASAPKVPEEIAQLIVEPEEPEDYVKEHHKFWDDQSNGKWDEVYARIWSQTSKGALQKLGDANFQNCLRISLQAVAHTQESPKDVDESVALLCRVVEVAQWSPLKAVSFVAVAKKNEIIEAYLKTTGLNEAPAEAQVDQLLEIAGEKEGEQLGYAVLQVVRKCVAEGLEEKALSLLEKYLKAHRPHDNYDGGDLLALWYALQWRQSGRKPKVVRKVAIVLFKSHHMKVVVNDDGTTVDGGVVSWDEKVLKSETVPDIERDWRLFSDAMCFLTDGAIGIEPLVVEELWDVVPKAFRPFWDSKYTRCISQSDFYSNKQFIEALKKWEDGYKDANGGETDVMAFHLLFPAAFPAEAKGVSITVGGISTRTVSHPAFKGRPAYQDEGQVWYHHHRLFWMFHETHHLYEGNFKGRFDFADLTKKSDHPMFIYDNWMEEFKGGNDFFPGEHWQGKSEFDFYVQSITRRLNTLEDPTFAEYWTSWWGGKKQEEAGAYHDFVSEHHALFAAGQAEDWEKVCELIESQLRPACCKRLGKSNYKTVVHFAVRALALTGKALDGPVLSALQRGMDVLEWPEEKAGELISLPGEQKDELLQLFQASDKPHDRPMQKLKKENTAISVIDDHHQMWDAFQEEDWQEVLEHVETQVTKEARERLGDGNFRNCFHMSFKAMGLGEESPKDVEKAVELIRKGMELTGWPLSTFRDLLGGHPKQYEVLKPFAPDDDKEGEFHDFVSEHHAFWGASTQNEWEKVCELLDSQLRPLCLKRLGEQNYRNVVTIGLRGLVLTDQALEGPVLAALRKGMEVLGYEKDKAPELINGIPAEKAEELLRIYGEDGA